MQKTKQKTVKTKEKVDWQKRESVYNKKIIYFIFNKAYEQMRPGYIGKGEIFKFALFRVKTKKYI